MFFGLFMTLFLFHKHINRKNNNYVHAKIMQKKTSTKKRGVQTKIEHITGEKN